MALLSLDRLTRRFGGFTAVDDVSLDIGSGEFFTLLGPSGCGKTTILRMIAGFDAPDAGRVLLEGQDLSGIPPERRPLHTVFQSYALFPHLTVFENVAFPLRMAGQPRSEIARRVGEMLEVVHLSDKADALPHELSGGQKQRVALARSLVGRPRLLLLDEPLGALDHKLREEMQRELIALQREVGITFVFVTHSQPEALALSHRIAVMDAGRVVQVGTPTDIYARPVNRFVADFIGEINLWPARVAQSEAGTHTLEVEGLGPVRFRGEAAGSGWFALRPEAIALDGSGANRHPAVVRERLYTGNVTTYRVALADGRLVSVQAAGGAKPLAVGEPVTLSWPEAAGLFLHA